MERDKLVGLCAKIVQTVATNTFFGAALYVNVVETPARKSLKSASAIIDHFQATFPRAKNMQAPLAALATVSGFLGWYFDESTDKDLLLGSTCVMMLVFPWTKIAIMPLNYQLMDQDNPKKKGDDWVQDMMNKWDRVHGVRTVLSFAAASCLGVYWIKKSL